MSFGYPQLFANGLNNFSQIRRSADMAYQRGGEYQVTLTGSTYEDSMELVVDMYANDTKVGQMSIVPFEVTQSGSIYYYQFGIRPYEYMSNYLESQHPTDYSYGNFISIMPSLNLPNSPKNVSGYQNLGNYGDTGSYNNFYKNVIKANYTYGYRYYSGGTYITEYTGSIPVNDYKHFWQRPVCQYIEQETPIWDISALEQNGKYFDLIGGSLQLDEHLWLPNNDQEVGAMINNGLLPNGGTGAGGLSTDYERIYSPTSQFIFDYPRTPYQSERSRFLTDAPRIQYITTEEDYFLYFLAGQTGDRKVIEADFMVVMFYDSNNNLVRTYQGDINNAESIYSPYGFVAPTGFTDTLTIWKMPCGPLSLNLLITSYINQSIDWSNIAYYTVQICGSYPNDSANLSLRNAIQAICPVSEMFYFYLKDNCGPEDTRIAWLNNRGGYDYYTFTSYRQDTKKISRQTYDNRYYQSNPNSPDRNMGRTIKTFATDIDQEIVLESDFLNLPTADWVQQLFYSPQVYIWQRQYNTSVFGGVKIYQDLTPVQILSTEVDTITKKHQKLNKYRITMKVANNFFVNKGF